MRQRKTINFFRLGTWLEDAADSLQRFSWKVQDFSFKRRKPYTGPHVTLADIVKMHDKNYRTSVCDMMMQTNEILADLPWREGTEDAECDPSK